MRYQESNKENIRNPKFNVFLILLFGLISLVAGAQNDVDFTSTSKKLYFSGQNIAISSELSKSGTSFTWTQNNTGTPRSITFTITGQSGNWDSATGTGKLEYSMTFDGEPSILTLIGDSGGITLNLALEITGDTNEYYSFHIDSISYQ